MRLDSVLELQAKILQRSGPGPGLAAQSAREGVSARRATDLPAVQPELALGIAPTGVNDFQLAIRLQRRSLVGSERVSAIIDAANGEAQLRYIGRVEKLDGHAMRNRHRPLVVGASIGHRDITAGTLGCFVRGKDGIAVLSNNHVLADENRADIGDPILQPGRIDDGAAPRDVVAHLAEYVPLAPTGTNVLDCAIATVCEEVKVDPARALGNETVTPENADRVEKLGRTTGLTVGRVTAFNVRNLVVEYDISDSIRFDGQIEIQAAEGGDFSLGGDSGSLVVTPEDRQPVGLLFAGSDQGGDEDGPVTYANPIADVLAALNVELYRHS